MRSKFKWIFTLLLALTLQFSFAQERTITGVVSDATGTLPGANVVVKGTTRGTQTDIDGKYSIQAKTGEVLVFSFVGMNDISVTVGASNTINATMQQGVALTEVVIDGYKTTSKKKASIAQTTVTAEGIEGRPNVSFLQTLQAQVSGLNIGTSSGSPGSSKIDVILRGVSSSLGSIDPLYVVDGIVMNNGQFRSINTEDIESVTVLKDAGATAIYGNRGSGGVVIVKTKRAAFNSKLSVRYTGSTGFTTLQDHDYNLPNARQMLSLQAIRGDGPGAALTADEIAAYPINTDWRDYFFRTGLSQSHNLSFTLGGDNVNNFTSFGYFNQDGIVPGTNFQRFTVRSNFNGKSTNGKFSYSTNFALGYSKRSQLDQETRTDINANVLQNPLQGLLSSQPYIDPSLYVNGQQLFDDFGAPAFEIVPYMLLDYLQPGNIPSEIQETRLSVSTTGTYKITDPLSYSMTAGVDYTQNNRDFARSPNSYLAIVAIPAGAQYGGIETMSTDRDFNFNIVHKLNYTKTFAEKHTIDANLFMEYTKAHRRFNSFTQTGLDPRTWAFGSGTGWIPFNTATPTFYRPTVAAAKFDAGTLSYFASADYDYNSRFGLVGTIRRDASYRFIGDKRWGTFWSVSGRWNIDQENFMKNTWFDQLKLRASYGTTGNQNIVASAYGSNVLYTANNLVRDLSSTQSGYNGSASLGIAQIANPALQWETTTQVDLGFDFVVKKRLSGTIDFYRKTTDDLFDADYTSAVTSVSAQNANTTNQLVNTGVEVLLKYDFFKSSSAFQLDAYINGSYNKNEWKNVLYSTPGQDFNQPGADYIQQSGSQFFAYYVVPYVGVNHENGNLLFLDANGNLTENPTDADRRNTNKSAIPVYQGSFGFNASYKGFFVNTSFAYAADVYKFDYDLLNLSNPAQIGQFPVVGELLNAWSPTNTSSNVPSLFATNVDAAESFSDRYLIDASYIRLKNLSFGYEVPSKMLEKTFLTGFKVYCQMENWITWSKWRGFDVDGLNQSNQGGYPSPKVISFGVDVKL
ncbi:MAG: SusC/RagA family TonB-linked outer membrane protein [Flavobacterium sp.]|nr:MAG: SusC/RagA family TonB-linked outer membrane protein [Flavobacterium sp.]